MKPEKYIPYVEAEENGLLKSWEQNNLLLSCQYMPIDYLILKQTKQRELVKKEFLKLKSETKETFEFKLKFERLNTANFLKSNSSGPEEFHKRTMYLSYDISQDLSLIIDGDTLACQFSHHERTYGNTPYETVLVSFPKLKKNNYQMTLIFNDRVFGLGKVNFKFFKEDLDRIPTLNLDKY